MLAGIGSGSPPSGDEPLSRVRYGSDYTEASIGTANLGRPSNR